MFAFLTDPATHPRVHRIDTHAASVFLEGARALKIKRAVRFPFLDYSTLAKRKAACDEEIRINRPFAPQIYHRVVPITQRSDGSLQIDGKGDAGRICDRNDPLRRTSDHRPSGRSRPARHRSGRGRLPTRSRPPTPLRRPRRPAPWINSIPAIIEDNAAAFREAACFAAGDIDDLRQASLSAFAENSPVAGAARQPGICAALPWRPASGEHRADRSQAGAVRCDRVRSRDGVDRCALRSCVPDDGFHPLRPAGRRERPAQPISGGHGKRKSRCARRPSAVHVAASGDPRQCAARPARPECARQGARHALGSRLFRTCAR